MIVQHAAAVGECKIGVHDAFDRAGLRLIDVDPVEEVASLAAVGTGVHIHGAPHRPWDPGPELQAHEPFARGRIGEHRIEDTRLGHNPRVGHLYVRERAGEPYGEAPYAAVEDEDVRATTKNGHGDAMLAGLPNGPHQIICTRRLQNSVGGAPDLPSRITL